MIMDSRSQFILQLFEKLGAPLLRAINSHAASAPDQSGEKDAQVIAALLSETVKISIAVAQAMNLKPNDGDADAIRVTLASMAGGLVADAYAQSGRLPTDADARRIVQSLESVLAFSDNFAPAAEHAPRLMTLAGTAPFFDPMQANLYAMNALVPAIAAIAEFPFGQSETKLAQDVAARLSASSQTLRKNTAGISADGADAKMAELVLLQSLAQIYACAHRAETARLKTLSEEARGPLSLDPVWALFDRQLGMLEVLLGAVAGASGSGKGGGGVKPTVETEEAAPLALAEETPDQAAPAAPSAPAAEQAAPAETPTDKPSNPMSFFKKQ